MDPRFVKDREIGGPKGRPTLLKRYDDNHDYLVLSTAESDSLTRRIYIPLNPDTDVQWARPQLTETLSGARPVISALGNADFVYVADEETSTGNAVRTVRIEARVLSADDPTLDGIPDGETKLNLSTQAMAEWKKS